MMACPSFYLPDAGILQYGHGSDERGTDAAAHEHVEGGKGHGGPAPLRHELLCLREN